MMPTLGYALLICAFASSAISIALGTVGFLSRNRVTKVNGLVRIARACSMACTAFLIGCCAILVYCFLAGDVSILYVLEERSLSTGTLAWLFKIAGLWAGRSGSLLFWTTLIAVFNFIIVVNSRKHETSLDNVAITIVQVVITVFVGILLFSAGNMPFEPTPERFFTETGELTSAASLYSMNQLLEHWAMAIHPPMLFVGYAGFTISFGYAVSALIVNDPSREWVDRSVRYVIASWLFLTAGIGLGSVWAYVVLGWGGYWGWDPVENASLLPWLIGVALIHTFTVYRERGAFKRWAVMCACLAFTFVIVATFVTRSGIVQSVHAFAGDPVSLVLFGGLIIVSLIVGVVGVVARWKSYAADVEGADDVENMFSKDAAYYFNNVIMVVFAILITYMTVSSALPSFLPFGGDSLSATAYEAIARPLGILYLLILAVCPLLAWGRTDPRKFVKQGRIPFACSLIVFVGLLVYWATNLRPAYYAMLEKGNSNSLTLMEAGPSWYYNALAVIGLLVASVLLLNALFMFVRNLKAPAKRASGIGGSIAHMGMAVILVGLVGSNMYVSNEAGYVSSDETSDKSSLSVQEYTLTYVDERIEDLSETEGNVVYEVGFDVFKDGKHVGTVHPQVQVNANTQQQKLNAAVMSFIDEDLFIVYRGINVNGDFSLDVRVNPLIGFVWVGFGLLMIGALVSVVGKRSRKTNNLG